jgi:hypothetical protein
VEGKGHRATEKPMTNVDVTNEFFDWLRCNLDRVFSDERIQRTLSEKLAEIHPAIRWEFGPYEDEKSFFAFSPNLDIKLLVLTERLVDAAPTIPHWVFLSSKPRKKWQSRSIEVRDNQGKVIQYNLDAWLYYLTSFNDGEFFDVNLVPYGYEDRPLDELKYVASLLVEFELGERMFIEFVDRINIVLPSELQEFGNKIENFHDQLVQELARNKRH